MTFDKFARKRGFADGVQGPIKPSRKRARRRGPKKQARRMREKFQKAAEGE